MVFVSPMVRTCQTAVNLFARHPNRDKIKFLLTPISKEGVNVSNDITHAIEHLMELYGSHRKE